jgi:hypothetical protein
VKRLEEVIDYCSEKIRKGELTLEECLKKFPEYEDELRKALTVANLLTQLPSPRMSPTFKENLREKVKRKTEKTQFARVLPFKKKVVALLAAVFLLSVTTATLAVNTKDPQSIFYPLKLIVEKAKLSFAFTPAQKAKLHLYFASERLDELKLAVSEGRSEYTADLSQAFAEELKEAEKNYKELPYAEQIEFQREVLKLLKEKEDLIKEKSLGEREKSEEEKVEEKESEKKAVEPKEKEGKEIRSEEEEKEVMESEESESYKDTTDELQEEETHIKSEKEDEVKQEESDSSDEKWESHDEDD